jgi:cytochrome c556
MGKAPLYIAAAAFLALSAAASVRAHEGATGVVKERMDAMESMAKAMKAVNQRLKHKRDLDAVKADARSIQEAAAKMLSLFPPGTNGHPSGAKAAVWRNWPDFEAKARVLATESGKLAEADTRDAKTLAAQARRISDACGSCHELYRVKHQH